MTHAADVSRWSDDSLRPVRILTTDGLDLVGSDSVLDDGRFVLSRVAHGGGVASLSSFVSSCPSLLASAGDSSVPLFVVGWLRPKHLDDARRRGRAASRGARSAIEPARYLPSCSDDPLAGARRASSRRAAGAANALAQARRLSLSTPIRALASNSLEDWASLQLVARTEAINNNTAIPATSCEQPTRLVSIYAKRDSAIRNEPQKIGCPIDNRLLQGSPVRELTARRAACRTFRSTPSSRSSSSRRLAMT